MAENDPTKDRLGMIERRIVRLQSRILILSFLCLMSYGLSVWLGMKVWFGNQVGGQQGMKTSRLTIAEEGQDESPGTGRWWLTEEEGPMLVLFGDQDADRKTLRADITPVSISLRSGIIEEGDWVGLVDITTDQDGGRITLRNHAGEVTGTYPPGRADSER